MEQSKSPLKILEVCRITPSPYPAADFTLPLTFFDLYNFIIPPTERILFYSLAADDPQSSLDSVLQKLKHSLSLTLSHFLPLAGNLVWPNDSPEPIILYKPGDSVSLTIAQTDADFDRLSSDLMRKANESHFLVPKLQTSDTVAPAMCLQITLFRNRGFSIGIITNHVVVDGKTSTMFLKSWASICKLSLPTLPPELTPVFDRTAAKDPTGIESLYVKNFEMFLSNPNSPTGKRLIRLAPKVAISDDVVKGTFELTAADIEKLRRKAATSSSSSTRRRLTTFVLTLAHVSTCMIKAQRIEPKSKIAVIFLVDLRPRSGTPVGVNYFGNAVCGYGLFMEAGEFEEENAMAMVSNKISDVIAEIEEKVKKNGVVEMLDEFLLRLRNEMPSQTIVVAGSPRFGIYDIDFGWGGCKKVEVTSVTPGGTFSMAESRNGNGGVEVGIALSLRHECLLFSVFGGSTETILTERWLVQGEAKEGRKGAVVFPTLF